MDDESRENEGDLILPAQFATTEKFAFLVRHSRFVLLHLYLTFSSGLVCLPTTGERLDQLGIPQMVPKNTEPHRTAFTISVDYAHGIFLISFCLAAADIAPGTTTGISAHDRALTARKLADSEVTDGSVFTRPGHIFPLRYFDGGVLKRSGHTEASVG
jgi:3,4-dihydroxy 2-butanone 4-phosphate synthase